MYKKLEEIVEREVKRSSKLENEYWGPLTIEFSDAFLTMAYSMLRSFFTKAEVKLFKAIYSTTTELVQNIAEYNKLNETLSHNQSFINLSLKNHYAQIYCSNQIMKKEVNSLTDRFVKMDNLSNESLAKEYAKALLNGGSLGLLMIYKLPGVKVKWNIKQDKDQVSWLNIYVKLSYASFRN